MGLPPFGVFAGFMGLLLASSLSSAVGPFIVLVAWLAASWYIMEMVQRLLFGPRNGQICATLICSIPNWLRCLILVLALLVFGLAPASLFGLTSQVTPPPPSWNRHMEPIDPSIDIESRRMELRGVVRLAGEVIAQYWPMRNVRAP